MTKMPVTAMMTPISVKMASLDQDEAEVDVIGRASVVLGIAGCGSGAARVQAARPHARSNTRVEVMARRSRADCDGAL